MNCIEFISLDLGSLH